MESKSRIAVTKTAYVIVWIITSVPLAWGFIMDSGDIHIWLARIEEVKNGLLTGKFQMFPSAELTVQYGGQFSALNSNVWLLLPAGLRMLGISVCTVYRIYMALLNVISVISSKKLFESIFQNKTTVFWGVLLYMTCPYRIYLCYDKAALGMVAAWSVLPFAIGGIMRFLAGATTWREVFLVSLVLALVGYGDGILIMTTVGILLIAIFWYRKWSAFLPVLLGALLFLPGCIYWLCYLIRGGMEAWNLPLESVASKGYALGQFFSSWVFQADCPGLGLGLLLSLFFVLWLMFTEKNLMVQKKCGFFGVIMCLMAFMTMKVFPWDVIQRLGYPFLRLVGLIETPGIFFGFACLAACVPGAYGMECVSKQNGLFVKAGFPLMIAIASAGVAIYMCNMLVYSCLPIWQ